MNRVLMRCIRLARGREPERAAPLAGKGKMALLKTVPPPAPGPGRAENNGFDATYR
jgi:hypothetical protein